MLKNSEEKQEDCEPLTLSTQSQKWFRSIPGSTVVVFIHGLFSDSNGCWSAKNGAFWPQLVADDSCFAGSSIYLGGYHTSYDSGNYDIAQCSRELFDGLQYDKAENKAPLDFPQIVLIAHSLGGIVARRMLEEKASKFKNKKIGLILMASPTLGSSFADALKPIAKLYGNKIATQLKTDSAMLADIDHRFRDLLESKQIPDISGAEACEHHGMLRFKYLPFRIPPVVTVASSSRYFGSPKIIPETDHSSIVKPTHILHESHVFLQNFFSTKFGAEKQLLPIETKIQTPAHILFDVYDRFAEPYCISRQIDLDVASTLKIKSVWLTGLSGTGKTTLIKRYLNNKKLKPLEVSLGHLDGEINGNRLTIELIESLNTKNNTTRSETFSSLVDELGALSKHEPIVLFLDELPISSATEAEPPLLLQYVSALIEATRNKWGSSVNFILCSIHSPAPIFVSPKLKEQVHFLRTERWSDAELNSLMELINDSLPQFKPDAELQRRIVVECNGIPRLLKAFYKRRIFADISLEAASESFNITMFDFPRGKTL